MANSHFVPVPGSYGEEYLLASRTLPTAVITASATVRHYLPLSASVVSSFPSLFYFKDAALTVGGSAVSNFAGAVTCRIVKRLAAGTIVPLTASTTITTGATLGQIVSFTVSTSITDADRTIRPNSGDMLGLEITASSTVTTQPTDVLAAVRLCVLN